MKYINTVRGISFGFMSRIDDNLLDISRAYFFIAEQCVLRII